MTILYSLLFFLCPLLISTYSSELFELPKMYFIYGLTGLIVGLHLLHVLNKKTPLIAQSPLNLPLLLFLFSQFLSTIFSMDPFTSFYGYYGRFDGGLLSTLCYTLLFFVYNVYNSHTTSKNVLRFSLLAGLLVSLYGIAQHFGIDAHVWQQDVQARVFSTLGQPNWLAAYMCILLPLTFLVVKKPLLQMPLLASQLLTILFTKSQSGMAACFLSLLICSAASLLSHTKPLRSPPLYALSLFVILSLVISNPIQDKILSYGHKSEPILKPETGEVLNITSSGDIRSIVWSGGIQTVKQHPLLGTGVETFAQSYYLVRPRQHNDTSEWNFLYNKAHNEYLNPAANTGLLGLFTFASFVFLSFKLFIQKKSYYLLASFISILITSYYGFNISVTSLYLFLLPLLWHENS